MLRLISQFDNEKIRVSSSTPSCTACCSCCCCSCLISTLAISHLSGRSLSNLIKRQQLKETTSLTQSKETKTAYLFGFFMPVILLWSIVGIFYGTVIFRNVISKNMLERELLLADSSLASFFMLFIPLIFIIIIGFLLVVFVKFIKLSFYGFYEKYDFLKKQSALLSSI